MAVDEYDEIFIQASQNYEQMANVDARFGPPVTTKEVEKAKESGVSSKTRQSTEWALNVWRDWFNARNNSPFVEEIEKNHALLEDVAKMDVESLVFWLYMFVVEVRKGNKECYPIYILCCGLQRHI